MGLKALLGLANDIDEALLRALDRHVLVREELGVEILELALCIGREGCSIEGSTLSPSARILIPFCMQALAAYYCAAPIEAGRATPYRRDGIWDHKIQHLHRLVMCF